MVDIWGSVLAATLCVPAIAILISIKHRRDVLTFLVGASAGLFGVQVFNVHVFTVVLLVWAFTSPRKVMNKDLALAAVIVVVSALLAVTAITGDLVNSPTLALQLLAMAVGAALLIFRSAIRDVGIMLYGLLTVCSAASLWAILQVAGIVPSELFHLNVSASGRPAGFYPEPDWLGLFAGIGLVLAWRMPVKPALRALIFSANGLAFVLAFARAAWVAVGASILAVVVVTLITRSKEDRDVPGLDVLPRSGRFLSLAAFIGAVVVALVALPSLASDLVTRLSRTLVADAADVSAQARVQQNDSLALLAQSVPWYGHGISTSGRVGVSGIIDYGDAANNVGSNWVASMWVDGAWLSIPLVILIIGTAIIAVKTIPGQILLIAILNSFFSNVIFQPITWFALGLGLALTVADQAGRSGVLADVSHVAPGRRTNTPAAIRWAGGPR